MEIIKLGEGLQRIVQTLSLTDIIQFIMIGYAWFWGSNKIRDIKKEAKSEAVSEVENKYLINMDKAMGAIAIELKGLSQSVIARQASDQVELNYIKENLNRQTEAFENFKDKIMGKIEALEIRIK